MAPRAFVSFELEDAWARTFLAQHAKDRRNDIQFYDYSVQTPWPNAWKSRCREKIALTRGTIVMVGPTTYSSEAVLWEIAETARQGHFMFGVQIHRDLTYRVPAGLPTTSVIRWNFEQIVKWLATWQ